MKRVHYRFLRLPFSGPKYTLLGLCLLTALLFANTHTFTFDELAGVVSLHALLNHLPDEKTHHPDEPLEEGVQNGRA